MSSRDYVWRLVGPGGLGAYRAGVTRWPGVRHGNRYSAHPTPWRDKVGKPRKDGVEPVLDDFLRIRRLFGFRSVTQARKWWFSRRDLNILSAAGFRLRVYRRADVREVVDGESQSIFDPGKAPFVDLPASQLWAMTSRELQAAAAAAFEARLAAECDAELIQTHREEDA